MALCPICGRTIGTWTNDPICATPTLSTQDVKGYTRILAKHIEEIQTQRNLDEIAAGITPTVFSPVNTTNLFQNWVKYITELRTSTEAILTKIGGNLADFLSKDEDGNPLSIAKTEWTDPTLEETKYQCKAIHIEDLRHFMLSSLGWIETFDNDGSNPLRPAYSCSHAMSIFGTSNPWYAYADDWYGMDQNIYGNHIWQPLVDTTAYHQGLAIVTRGVAYGATGSASIQQTGGKLNINMSVAEATTFWSPFGHHIGLGLRMWWVTNPGYVCSTATSINNVKFKIEGLTISGGEVGIGIRVSVSYRNLDGALLTKLHNISFINKIFPADIWCAQLWGGNYFLRYRENWAPSENLGSYDVYDVDPGLFWILDPKGTHGNPTYKTTLANGSYNLLTLINSIPTFQTYVNPTWYTWAQMNYQTSNPSGMNYVESMTINEVRIESAVVQKGEQWNPYTIPATLIWQDSDTPLSFSLDTLRIYV